MLAEGALGLSVEGAVAILGGAAGVHLEIDDHPALFERLGVKLVPLDGGLGPVRAEVFNVNQHSTLLLLVLRGKNNGGFSHG